MKPPAVSGNVDDPRLEGTQHPNFGEAFRFWLKLGFISFGGPTGQIAIMHAELVEKRNWISEAHAFSMHLTIVRSHQVLRLSNWRLMLAGCRTRPGLAFLRQTE